MCNQKGVSLSKDNLDDARMSHRSLSRLGVPGVFIKVK